MTYEMKRQLARGEEAELRLDRHFADRFEICTVTRKQQRQGIDRIFVQHKSQRRYLIEYKTDWTAGRTGNVFIETVSVDTKSIPGWAYSSQSDWLIYYIPKQQRAFILSFVTLRSLLPAWIQKYKAAPPIPNRGYNTLGILVPLSVFEFTCQKVERVSSVPTSRQ